MSLGLTRTKRPKETCPKAMTDNTQDKEEALDEAAQMIADVRVKCLQLGLHPKDLSKIMLDEAALSLIASGSKLSVIQAFFKKYSKVSLPRFYSGIKNAAERTLN